MKIPLNWLKDYIETDRQTKEIADKFTALGLLLDKPIEKVGNTEVLDLEHRMDRADWLSVLGCARDLAAMLNIPLKHPKIDDNSWPTIGEGDMVKVTVEGTGFVNRFYTRVFKNVTVGESPEWLKERLEAYGLPSINNIVDITNFVMVELGQPMHAHDLDKMATYDITFRKAKQGETVTTLLGENITLSDDIWISTTNGEPTGIGGIVGGQKVAIDNTTKNIVLDSGNYDQATIRRSSRKLKIYNETVLRDDKYLHPENNERAIKRATQLILEICGPNVEVFENADYYPTKWPIRSMIIRLSRLKQISGQDFDIRDVRNILESLEFKMLSVGENQLQVEVPFFRTDVEVEDDLVSEILRIKNYNQIPLTPIQSAPPKEITPKIYKFEDKLRDLLVKQGLHEHITDPLVQANNVQTQVLLQNALSSEKNALRRTIAESLEPVLSDYRKHKVSTIGIFELGLTYESLMEDPTEYQNYKEKRELCVLVQSSDLTSYELSKWTKTILATLLHELGVSEYVLEGQIVVQGKQIGKLEVDKITISTEVLMALTEGNNPTRARSIIPNNTKEDISIVCKIGGMFGTALSAVKHNDIKNIKDLVVKEEYIDEEKLGKDNKAILLEVTYNSGVDTEKVRKELIALLTKEFGITIRTK